jgi:flavin-dependent dehydrogenase
MAVQGSLGPLADGATAAVIGGGPAGCSVALKLLRMARESGKRFNVKLFEPKSYGVHYNQCLGVLSPPVLDILHDEFGLKLPGEMIQRRIAGYILRSGREQIVLEEGEEDTVAVRRVELDNYLLEASREAGAEVIRSRVTALELGDGGVTVFSEGEYTPAQVVFGCFGLDAGMAAGLRRQSFYRPPSSIETLVTKYDCPDELIERFNNMIQAYLPRIEGVEFAAITPKAKHASVVLAGKRIDLGHLDDFLRLPEVREFLPGDFKVSQVYKGAFPGSPARNYYQDRFAAVGDAAGMIRPFKGKGINSAIITGIIAARTAVETGISRGAFRRYEKECAFITRDYPYGRFVRFAAKLISKKLSMGPVIRFAKENEKFRWALTKSVSGGATYREIVLRCLRPGIALGLLGAFLSAPFRHGKK